MISPNRLRRIGEAAWAQAAARDPNIAGPAPVHAELGTALHRIVDLESSHARLRAALERLADVCPVTPATLPALEEACAILLETAK